MKSTVICLLALVLVLPLCAQREIGFRPTDSGGPLREEQAAYDVRHYDLDLEVFPETQSIAGTMTVTADVTAPLAWFVLDLDTRLTVSKVEGVTPAGDDTAWPFERRGGQIFIRTPKTLDKGDTVAARITYSGKPKEAPYPPWAGGLTWKKTADGLPWIGTSVQLDGPDLWLPSKDHPSDEADTCDLRFTVPEPLVVASNGVLKQVEKKDGKRTYHWHVANPINTYNIALNVAPYQTIEGTYKSVAGEVIPVTYWVLPENYEKGKAIFKEFVDHLAWYEKLLGPYPFRNEKYGVVETPFLGMEHQTIIAYGNNYQGGPDGFDWLHHHELGHEWWGNLVTNRDWKDFWIHEAFCSYMQGLYSEDLNGDKAYHQFIGRMRSIPKNVRPVVPSESVTLVQRYSIPPAYVRSEGDFYAKGILFLNVLRFMMGKETLLKALRRMAYPNPAMEKITDGSQTRMVDTEDFLAVCEKVSGMDLDWVFDVYLRQPKLPKLEVTREKDRTTLRWHAPGGELFPMPIEVKIGERVERIPMPNGYAILTIPEDVPLEVDPKQYIYRESM